MISKYFPTPQFVFQVVEDYFICWAEAFKFDIVPFDFVLGVRHYGSTLQSTGAQFLPYSFYIKL